MKKSSVLILVAAIAVLIFSSFVYYFIYGLSIENEEFYVGIAFCGNTTQEAKLLIDRIKTYTNLFVLQSGPISKNKTAINEICDYAVSSDLDFVVFLGWFDFDHPWQVPWLDEAKERWGDRFLGLYLYDEPGGIQVDYDWTTTFHYLKNIFPEIYSSFELYVEGNSNVTALRDYSEATKRHIDYITRDLRIGELLNRSIRAITSDYALYWFDYLAGYETVYVQLGWNHSTAKHIGLCRGAANAQNKDWGSIIVWNGRDEANNQAGLYKTGEEMLIDMKISYQTGAKYVIIFNYPTYPEDNKYGILTNEHFTALEEFWNYFQQNPNDYGLIRANTALVLPKDYGWGMRHPEDRIWGYWGPDELSPQIWNITQDLVDKYGLELDIVYDDPTFPIKNKYETIYYWNQTLNLD
ncbi:MAG: hypothetical protein NWF10_05020 [Candidatus Bathyarchaeota archaeon]|jgi:hypothetical protein|nr:hypothetical protein [Candidatus Bathyarchaeota archaeon]